MNIEQFTASKKYNYWLREKHMNVYVRKSIHALSHQIAECLDIANIEVDEKYRGKGIFTAFLARAEQQAILAGKDAVYVESILNPKLLGMLIKRGYTLVPNTNEISPCVFKLVSKELNV